MRWYVQHSLQTTTATFNAQLGEHLAHAQMQFGNGPMGVVPWPGLLPWVAIGCDISQPEDIMEPETKPTKETKEWTFDETCSSNMRLMKLRKLMNIGWRTGMLLI